jgi:hypothetical protein
MIKEKYLLVVMESTGVTQEADSEILLDEGDHDRFSHYARKADIVESAVTGKPIVALCGKVWVPDRNPDRFPLCPRCKDLYEQKKFRENK